MCVCFFSCSFIFIYEFRCQGETVYNPPFLYTLFFLIYFSRGFLYSAQAFILFNVRGRLFQYSAFPLHFVFAHFILSAGFSIRCKYLFYLMSGGDFLNIPPFLYTSIILISRRFCYFVFLLSPKFYGFAPSVQLSYTAFLGPMPA